MKKLFNLKMVEEELVAQHLNEFNTIINQLASMEIDFDDEIRALIMLASLPNSWEAMRMAVSSSAWTSKLKYEDIRDLILSEEMHRKDSSEASCSGAALNLETRGRGYGRSEFGFCNQPKCWNYGKTDHFKKNYKEPRKKTGNDSANVVTEEIYDALILSVNSPFDSWVLDSGAFFHTIVICEILKNYVARDFGKVYLADGSGLDIVGMGDARIRVYNDWVW
jgi:hypothetical protein